MPEYVWSAPVLPLGINSPSPAIAAAITDISPQQTIIYPGTLNVGTRIRLRAFGEYTSSANTANFLLGFYIANLGTAIASAVPIAATAATATLATSTAFPWMLEWEGQVRALTSPIVGATNAQLYGMGKAYLPATLTTFTITAIPITAALRTVQQTANGLITSQAQLISVANTPSSTTASLTSLTCDELTCELLG